MSYQNQYRQAQVRAYSPGIAEFLIGLIIGGLIFPGPFIWSALGRQLVKEAVARGAEVTKEKVEEWIRKGEEKLKR